MPNKNYTMKMGSRQIDGDTAFRMDSYAMQYNYAMRNDTDPNKKSKRSGLPASSTDVLPKGEPTKPHPKYAELGYMKAHRQEETGNYIAVDGSAHKTPLAERSASAKALEKAQKIMRAKRSGKKN